ncbi:tRNA(Ile)-lysidine synthetase [Hydrogenophaga crassostreae]|uniref:tRNA(Ile)-lysidine synthase n=1 Tax=Hydrogenophaga crassostreae TaxID=1763535 RepID=A0A167H1B9_9BURK|nr:tRNA lysidine(34) synthetase TilS [Hydrogenophaga crassostreae]OAD40130.1 tRNA(Ile)-lysidine synthetase [Hydrogenophaga crassostreae]
MAQWSQRWPLDLVDARVRVGVAFSAGADSTALLMAAASRWPGRVVALHVHHGLQAAADHFVAQAQSTCDGLGVELKVVRIKADHSKGESPEDAARRARYLALAEMALEVKAGCVLLGQHADDQVETFFIALGRGAGLPGLSAMGAGFTRHGVFFGRPFLGLSTQTLRDSVASVGQAFVEDPSNTDQRFTRNRIRARLLPAWADTFPGFREAIARTARHAAQAQSLLGDLADIDLDAIGRPPRIAQLQTLPPERQSNALRRWLKNTAHVVASDAQMQELLSQIDACRTRGHHIHIKVAHGHVEREGAHLAFRPPL